MWMQDQVSESFRLSWIESSEFGEEFKELKPDRSTKIAPLWSLNLRINSLSFYLVSFSFAFHCLQCQATTTTTTFSNSNNNLTKDLLPFSCTLLDEGQTNRQTTRLHNTLYITSLVLSHEYHGPSQDAEV